MNKTEFEIADCVFWCWIWMKEQRSRMYVDCCNIEICLKNTKLDMMYLRGCYSAGKLCLLKFFWIIMYVYVTEFKR